jgi:hypothetical protein
MSIANLFVPNDLNLFCGTITQSVEPSPIEGSITLTDLTDQITFGVLPDTTILNAPSPTSTITLTLPNSSTDTLVARNTTDVLTNKTISNTSNTITVGGVAIGSLINQDVRTTSSPTFSNLHLSGVINDNSQTNVLVLNGSDTLNVRTIGSFPNPFNQSLNTTDSPSFVMETLSGTSNQLIFGTTDTTTLNSPAPGSPIVLTLPNSANDTLVARSTTDTLTNKTIADTSNTITVGGTAIGSLINQDVRTTASPTFFNPTVTNINTGSLTYTGVAGTTAGVLVNQGMGIVNITPMPSGQLLIGDLGVPTVASLTGTNITVTGGPGTLNVSVPQSIAPGSSPTFANITDSGLTANGAMYASTSGLLASTGAMTNGQLLIGSTGAAPQASTLTVSANLAITNAAHSISLDTVQPIQTSSSPTFANITDNGLIINGAMFTGTSGVLASTGPLTNGQLLIGSTGAAPQAGTLTVSSNLAITNAAHSISLDTAQGIQTTSSPKFANVYIGSSTAANTSPLQFDSTVGQKIRFFDMSPGSPNNFQYYGFGIAAGILQYYVSATTSNHEFYAGNSTTTSLPLLIIFGTGSGISIPLLSGSSPNYDIGGGNSTFGNAGGSGAWFSGTAVGDTCIRNNAQKIHIGVTGASTAQAVISSNLVKMNAYVQGGFSTPTGVAGGTSIVGTGASVSATGSQLGGTITVTTGTGVINVAGVVATITLPVAAPISTFGVVLFAANSNASIAPLGFFATAASTTTFTISNSTPLSASSAYIWNWAIAM